MRHICANRLIIIGSNNGLLPGRRQAIIWINAGIVIIGPLGTNFNEISIKIYSFSFRQMHLKMSSGKWRPFCLGFSSVCGSGVLCGCRSQAKASEEELWSCALYIIRPPGTVDRLRDMKMWNIWYRFYLMQTYIYTHVYMYTWLRRWGYGANKRPVRRKKHRNAELSPQWKTTSLFFLYIYNNKFGFLLAFKISI